MLKDVLKLKKNPKDNKKKTDKTEGIKDIKEKVKKKFSLGAVIIIGAVALLVIFLSTIGYLVYGQKNESPFIKSASRFIPYPASIVDGRYVTVFSYLDQLDVLKNYYKEFKKLDLNSEEGKKTMSEVRTEVLDRLNEDAVVSAEAKKNGRYSDKERS